MITIVSITPLPLNRDSRALKIASSFARNGYRSIVLQGKEGGLIDKSKITELRTISVEGFFSSDKELSKNIDKKIKFIIGVKRVIKSLIPIKIKNIIFLYFHKQEIQNRYYSKCVIQQIPSADIYYVHSWEYGRACCEVASSNGALVVYDAHDLYSDIARENANFNPLNLSYAKITERLEQDFLERADAVVTVCEGIADILMSRGASKTIVVRNSHDFRLDSSDDVSLSEFCNTSFEQGLTGIVIGNNKAAYPIEDMFSVVSIFKGRVRLIFLGQGFEEMAQKAKSHSVLFPGACDPSLVVPLARHADFSIVPYVPRTRNDSLSLPNKFFQSLAAGLPVIFQSLPEMKRISEEYNAGVALKKMCAAELEPVIRRLLSDVKYRSELSRRSQRASEKLNWEQEESKLLDLVVNLLRK
tara:strand:- start:61 stop:1305 length:1245 start_codon:yes stop_codon:yes gene_type:complete